MIYLKWTQSDLVSLGTETLYTEIDEDGWVQREVGLYDDGSVAYQLVPSHSRPGWFGLVRLSAPMLESNVTEDEFEALWECGVRRVVNG